MSGTITTMCNTYKMANAEKDGEVEGADYEHGSFRFLQRGRPHSEPVVAPRTGETFSCQALRQLEKSIRFLGLGPLCNVIVSFFHLTQGSTDVLPAEDPSELRDVTCSCNRTYRSDSKSGRPRSALSASLKRCSFSFSRRPSLYSCSLRKAMGRVFPVLNVFCSSAWI